MTALDIDLTASPTVGAFVRSDAVMNGIIGPFGSGKSVGCATWILRNSMEQPPAKKDNIRYTRWAVVRNTSPELRSTTIKTVQEKFPEGPHGHVVYTSPITYHVKFPARSGGIPGLDCEIMFVPLDRPKDVRKLLSMELTGAWINEAREVVKPIIDAIAGRAARYPSGDRGRSTKPMIAMDTNAPDEDSWWPDAFDATKPPIHYRTPDGDVIDLTWRLYRQPPAVLELVEIAEGKFESKHADYPYIYEADEVIPAADTFWGVNPEAENLKHLNPVYYPNLILNKTREFIRVYGEALYGYVQDGKAVVPEFYPQLMVGDFPVVADAPLIIGIDIGGGTLQPAGVIFQRHPLGHWLVHREVVGTDMGVDRFAEALRQAITEHYEGMEVKAVWLDPASETKDEIFEIKVVEYMRSKGFPCRLAPTQDWRVRRQAIATPCGRLIMGKPGLIIHRRCRTLISGLKGKWQFRRLQLVGVEQYATKPDKGPYSHVCEALGYGLCGAGERHVPVEHPKLTSRTIILDGRFDPLAPLPVS